MKFEFNECSDLFKATTIPDLFFMDYLPEMPPDYIKIYLYMIFLCKNNKPAKINDLSKKLNLPIKTITDRLEYLEQKELILKKGTGFIINNISEITLHKLYTPSLTIDSDKAQDIAKNKSQAKVIDEINKKYFQGMMAPTWFSDITNWFNQFGFDDSVMYTLFDYCYNKSQLNHTYTTTVAQNWHLSNIKTFEELDIYLEKHEKFNILQKQISKKLNKFNGLTQYEQDYLKKWFYDFDYDFSIIEIALKRSTFKQNITFEYLNTLITSWHDNNLKTVSEINEYIEKIPKQKQQQQQPQTIQKNVKKAQDKLNYMQRDYENLDIYYANNNIEE